MAESPLGHTLIIANPVAHSGAGEKAVQYAERFLSSYAAATRGYEIKLTERAGHAEELAAASAGFDSVLVLGGDGVIHEAVNGLMKLDAADRPQLGIIPMGSGNDYARTLGMVKNDAEAALSQLVRSTPKPVELGCVNGVYYAQTLSFGLDAAIALDTTKKRADGTTQEGEQLFIASAIRILARAGKGAKVRAVFDGGEPLELTSSIIFALQVGPSYGGGFKICPDADPTDGLLNTCYNVKKPLMPQLMALLAKARFGKHVSSPVVELRSFKHAVLDFEVEPPCQVDGEPLEGTRFEVDVVPEALHVLFPAEAEWPVF